MLWIVKSYWILFQLAPPFECSWKCWKIAPILNDVENAQSKTLRNIACCAHVVHILVGQILLKNNIATDWLRGLLAYARIRPKTLMTSACDGYLLRTSRTISRMTTACQYLIRKLFLKNKLQNVPGLTIGTISTMDRVWVDPTGANSSNHHSQRVMQGIVLLPSPKAC